MTQQSRPSLCFEHALCVMPDQTPREASLCCTDGRIAEGLDCAPAFSIDAEGMTLLPALINAHDHFRGAWLPRCGNPPYDSVYDWLADLHAKPRSKFAAANQRDLVDNPTLYQLGAYKNIFSGVATALDHYLRVDEPLHDALPLRTLNDYGRESQLAAIEQPDRNPPWGWGARREFEHARQHGLPFVIHCAEGFDAAARRELSRLDGLGLLDRHTLLIHCIGCGAEDYAVIAKAGASIAWCPMTYNFLYRRAGDLRPALELGVNVALGTDSCLTGGINMIEELRCARELYRQGWGGELPLETLLRMVTSNAARALCRENSLGRLDPGYSADVLLLKRRTDDPLAVLTEFDTVDIDLLLLEERPLLGSARHAALFEAALGAGNYSAVRVRRTHPDSRQADSTSRETMLVIGDPAALLRRVRSLAGQEFNPAYLPLAD